MKKAIIYFSLVVCSSFIYSAEETVVKKFEPSYLSDTRFTQVKEIDGVGTIHLAYEGAVVVARAYGGIGEAVIVDVTMKSNEDNFVIGQCSTVKGGKSQIEYVSNKLLKDLNPPMCPSDLLGHYIFNSSAATLGSIANNAQEKIVREYTSEFEKRRDDCLSVSPEHIAHQLTGLTKAKVCTLMFSLSIKSGEFRTSSAALIRSGNRTPSLLMDPFGKPEDIREILLGINSSRMVINDNVYNSIVPWRKEEKEFTEIAEILLYHHNKNIEGNPRYNAQSRPLMTFVHFPRLFNILTQNKKD